MLAKRLIHTLSVSMDAEEGMISRLKVSCHSIALTASYAKPVPGNGTRVIWQRGRRRRGKRALARFSRQFSQSLHISSRTLWIDHWMISLWDWVGGGGGVLCTTVLQAHPLCRTTPLIPVPPPNFHLCRSLCNFSCPFCPIWCAKQTWPSIWN